MANIFRKNKTRENPYVMVDKEFINDPDLSAKAKGILLYLLSKPDDWEIYQSDIGKHMKDGRVSIQSGIDELLAVGYLDREQIRNDRGQFIGYKYQVFESPMKSTESRKPVSGKPATTNNNLTNIKTIVSQEKKESKKSEVHQRIFACWNEQQIVKHKKMTPKMVKEVDKLLKGKRDDLEDKQTEEDIVQAIKNYGRIVNSPKYFFKYKWKLDEFLRRGYLKFQDWNLAKQNYAIDRNGFEPEDKPSLKDKAKEQTKRLLEEERRNAMESEESYRSGNRDFRGDTW